jgi:hypothetical protein
MTIDSQCGLVHFSFENRDENLVRKPLSNFTLKSRAAIWILDSHLCHVCKATFTANLAYVSNTSAVNENHRIMPTITLLINPGSSLKRTGQPPGNFIAMASISRPGRRRILAEKAVSQADSISFN